MTKVVGVAGTWGYTGKSAGQWWDAKSEWFKVMKPLGVEPLRPEDPFVWSTDVDGTWMDWLLGRWKFSDWGAGAKALVWYLKDVPYEDRNIVAHSHGGQVAAMAATMIPIRRLITVATPYRKDLDAQYKDAARNIGYWVHVYSDKSDLVQLAGSLFDGHLGFIRKMCHADLNIMIPKIGHSGILYVPKNMQQWSEGGLADYLKTEIQK